MQYKNIFNCQENSLVKPLTCHPFYDFGNKEVGSFPNYFWSVWINSAIRQEFYQIPQNIADLSLLH